MTKAQKEEKTMAEGWKLVIKLANRQKAWREFDPSVLSEMAEIFRKRCRRQDSWRKRNACALTGAERKFQFHGRSAVLSMFTACIGYIGIVDRRLDKADQRQCLDGIAEGAAILVTHAEVINAGGITREYVERLQSKGKN